MLQKLSYALLIGITIVMSSPASADLNERIEDMCQKVKHCSLKELGQQDLPTEMKQMMESMFESTCVSWVKPYADTVGQAGVEEKATACLESFIEADCEELMNSEGDFQSPACTEFRDATEGS